jgi:hypothetical protein
MGRLLQLVGSLTLGLVAAGVVVLAGPTTEVDCDTTHALNRAAYDVLKQLDDVDDGEPLNECEVPSRGTWVWAGVALVVVAGGLMIVSTEEEEEEPPPPRRDPRRTVAR